MTTTSRKRPTRFLNRQWPNNQSSFLSMLLWTNAQCRRCPTKPRSHDVTTTSRPPLTRPIQIHISSRALTRRRCREQDEHQAWAKAHPVKENGEWRPWDEVNDFKNPADKLARAKKITDDIFKLTQRKAAKTSQNTMLDMKLRMIRRKFN